MRPCVLAPQAADAHRRLGDVLQRGEVREQVEPLEDHPDLRALARDLALGQLVQPVARLPVAGQLAAHPEPPGVDLLQVVDAPQQRGLPGSRRPEQAQHLAGTDIQRDALEYLTAAEPLVHGLYPHCRVGHPGAPRARRRSMKCCAIDRIVVKRRYQMHATRSSGTCW